MNDYDIKRLQELDEDFLKGLGLPYPYIRPPVQWLENTDPDKTINYADLHEPYADDDLLKESLKHKDAETAIVGGDLADYYSKSRFKKNKNVDFKEEVRAVFYRMEWLSIHFKRVKIIIGNHDNRPEKKINEILNLTGELDLNIMTEQNLTKRLASYFDNVEIVGTKLFTDSRYNNKEIELSHIYQYGDIIFTHAELSREQETATLGRISLQLSRWSRLLELKPYRVIIQAHNHTAMKAIKGSELLMLTPCVMYPKSTGAEYIFNSRLVGSPPVNGYTIIYQHNGVTDFNRTNFFVYNT